MKLFKQYLNEKGRCWPNHRPVPGKKPYSPGSCVKESSAAAIAAATAIAKKKSGDYDSKGFRKTKYKNPDAPNVKSNAQRKKELDEGSTDMKPLSHFLGPEATKKQDSKEIARQKQHLTNKSKEYKDQSARENGGAAAYAKGITFDLAKKNIEENKSGDHSLHDWFKNSKSSDGKPGWVQLGGKYAGKSCAKQPGQTSKPKCGSSKMFSSMSKKEKESATRRKRREDPNASRSGKAINVATEEYMNEDACTTKVKSRYSVWPSAYASGALVKCRKVGAANWGNKSKKEDVQLKSFKKFIEEDGMGGGAMSGTPTNNVGGGNIAGSGGAGGEPGVSRKRNPIMSKLGRRNPPKM